MSASVVDRDHIDRPRQIPSLDGVRALAVGMVVLLHVVQGAGFAHVPLWLTLLAQGQLGVFIFFVLSGYLITTLLLREESKRGSIDLKSFYVRRSFRILPPAYVYIIFLLVLSHFIPIKDLDRTNVIAYFTMTANYFGSCWAGEHLWSLGVEEQFYLLWPPVLVFCLARAAGLRGRSLAAKVGIGVVLAEPVIRVAFFLFLRHHANPAAFWMICDPLMFGVLVALLSGTGRFEALYRSVTRWPYLLPVFLFLVSGYLNVRFQNYWNLTVGMSVNGFLAAMWILWLTRHPRSRWGVIFNQPVVMWFGRLSYSIYIWQLFFLHPQIHSVLTGTGWWTTLPMRLLYIMAVAVASHYLIELPSLRIRDKVLGRLHWKEI